MLSLLDKSVRTARWNGKPLPEVVKASVKEKLNGDCVLTFTYPLSDSKLYSELKEDYLIRCPVPDLDFQLFRIKQVIEQDSSVEVTAYHISDDIMTRLIKPFSCQQVPCATALSSMVMASKTALGDFSFTSDISKNRTYTADKEQTLYSAFLEGKHSIVGTWEGELIRDNLALTVKSSRGENRGVIISTHHNLKKYQRTRDSSKVITRIHATSTFKQEGQDKETTLSVTVDSPLIHQYPFINEVTYTNNNITTTQELVEWAKSKFRLESIDKPNDKIVIEAFELDGQTVHLGDIVILKSRIHHIDMMKKAVAYDYDPLSMTYRSITFDDESSIGGSTNGDSFSSLAQTLLDSEKKGEDVAVERALENANRAFDAAFNKRKIAIDDAIQRSQSHGEVYADKIRAKIESDVTAIQRQIEAQEKENEQAIRGVLKTAGVNTNLANEAISKAEQAQSSSIEALKKAEQAKNAAIQEANKLLGTERTQTESKIASAKSQAIAEVSRLLETAKSLLTRKITDVNTSLVQTKESIKLLATKQSVENVTNRIASAEASLQVQAGQIDQRVKTSDFDQAKKRISTAETSITQLGNRLTTELTQVEGKIPTSFDTVNLMKDTDTEFVMGYGISNTTWNPTEKKAVLHYKQQGVAKALHTEILPQFDKFFQFIPQNGTIYTQSLLVDTDARFTGNKGLEWTWFTNKEGHQIVPAHIRKIGENTYQLWSTFTWSLSNERLRAFDIMHLQRVLAFWASGTYLKFYKPKLTVGEFPSDWSPAPEDVTDTFSAMKTAITQTAAGVEQLSSRVTDSAGKISQAETKVRQLVSDVSSRVSQTDFNAIKKTVESHATSINQTNQAILLKADKSVVNGVKSTADSALSKANTNASQISQTKAELKVSNDAISQKISKTDFNKLTTRVSNTETSIQTQAGHIAQRLTTTQVHGIVTSKGYQTKAQVDSNITGRGYLTNTALTSYATKTVLDNKVKETSDSFHRLISETKAQIPTSISHRNVVAGTSDRWGTYQDVNSNSNWLVTLGRIPFGDSTGIYAGTKVHLYVHISADSIVLDSAVADKAITLQGMILGNNGSWTWDNWTTYHPFANQWRRQLNAGNNYHLIKLSTTVTPQMYSHSKGFEINFRLDGVKTGKFHWRALMVTTGDTAPNYWTPSFEDYTTTTAFHSVSDTVSSHTRTISEHSSRISQVIQTATGIVTRVGNLENSRATNNTVQAIQTQMNTLAGAWSIRNLTSAGAVLNQLNLNRDGSIKIDGKLIQITGRTYIQDGVISNAKISGLDAGKIMSGLISSARIGAETITADKVKVDQAFFNKFMAVEAYLRQLFSKSAFINQVQAVTLSANKISGGILAAINGAMKINLSSGNIKFFTNSPSISREVSGYPNQWVSFETGTSNGKPCGVTVIGSNRWNNWNSNDGGFVGIRAWNGANDDQIEIVGDKVRLASAPFTNPDGWEIVTLPNQLSIDAFRTSDRPSSVLNIGDVRVFRNNSNYVSLKEVLHQFNHNFKHLVNITGRGDVILTWDTIK